MLPRLCAAGLAGCLAALAGIRVAHAAEWLPITPEELKETQYPLAPGAPAIYLYRQVDRSDSSFYENTYIRIKVLSDAGRRYGSIEIPFARGAESIRDIRARTIRPDGSIVEFNGQVYEKTIVQGSGVKLLEKAFTLPDVDAGSIIEYRYTRSLPYGWVFDSHWIISQNLFTKRARFSLEPNRYFSLRWSWPRGLPPGSGPPKSAGGRIQLEVDDVPAVAAEDFMPPADEMKYRVDFIYIADSFPQTDPVKFWKWYAKRQDTEIERFANQRAAMSRAVSSIILPSDAPAVRLRKIYSRVTQLHNIDFENPVEREARHEEAKDIKSVADVWSRGYGDASQITWLCLALARAAGLDADPAVVATRDRYFFDPSVMNPGQLNSYLLVVTLDGKDTFLDPGVPFTPFGMLPWYETDVRALRLGKERGQWTTTPLPLAADSEIARKAVVRLDAGSLDGKLTVTYTGLEASWRRVEEMNEDDDARRKYLENDVASVVPTGINIKLVNAPDWTHGDVPLLAEFDLQVPGWMTPAGHHGLLPSALFGGGEQHTFEHPERTYPVYFDFPYRHEDDVTLELPAEWSVNSVPAPRNIDLKAVAYRNSVMLSGRSLHLMRELTIDGTLISTKYYDTLRRFFQLVRAGDEDQIVVAPTAVVRSP